jgi:hypothetical protein
MIPAYETHLPNAADRPQKINRDPSFLKKSDCHGFPGMIFGSRLSDWDPSHVEL